MTEADMERIARQRLTIVRPAEKSVRQSIRITERLVFAVSLIAVIFAVWFFSALIFSFV